MADFLSPRLRGRAGQARRARLIPLHPVCAECSREGVLAPTDELDHIIPLHQGGPDHEDNMQGLCHAHHAAKTRLEGGNYVSNHPDWLKPSAIPLTILCGPPCAGKSTLARTEAGDQDLIIDLDDILQAIDPAYRPWSGERQHLNEAIQARNRMLGSLAFPEHLAASRAWFIIQAPSPDERSWWKAKLGGEIRLLHPGTQVCKDRAIARGSPAAVQGVDDWELRSRQPWQRPVRRIPVDSDGWPKG